MMRLVPISSSSRARLTVPTVTVAKVRPDRIAIDDAAEIVVALTRSLDVSEKLPIA